MPRHLKKQKNQKVKIRSRAALRGPSKSLLELKPKKKVRKTYRRRTNRLSKQKQTNMLQYNKKTPDMKKQKLL
jgi:hypothetical protein